MRFEVAEQIVVHRILSLIATRSDGCLRWVAGCYRRCTEEHFRSSVVLHRLWKSLISDSSAAPPPMTEMQNLVVNYAVLAILCPEFFRSRLEFAPHTDGAAELQAMLRLTDGACPQFVAAMLERIDEEGGLQATVGPVVTAAAESVRGRSLTDMRAKHSNAIIFISSFKLAASVLATAPEFLPPTAPWGFSAQASGCGASGWQIQNNSILGRLLSPSPLDFGLASAGEGSRNVYFSAASLRNVAQMAQSTAAIRNELTGMHDAVNQLVKNLCKAGPEARRCTFKWFASVIGANAGRATISGQQLSMQLAGLPGMAKLLLETRGLSSAGFCVNVFWALLLLCEPIKVDRLSELDPMYIFRKSDPDSGTLLE
eukprot:Polyplicarium_translucidae@DN3072_c0_g1_i4.p1